MAKAQRVCIIGGGAQGLTALKNLLELNTPDEKLFDAEILETRDSIGGIWKFSDTPGTITALQSTLANVSKWRNCYSDFSVDEAWKAAGRGGNAPVYLEQDAMECYLEQYARKFDLLRYVRLGSRVSGFRRLEEKRQWEVFVTDAKTGIERNEIYDKIVTATGQYSTPYVPKIEGIENFQGRAIHCSDFKR